MVTTLAVTKREKNGPSSSALLRTGKLVGVVYGASVASTPIELDARAFEKVFREAGEATIVSLSGLGADIPTLIHAIDFDPLTNQPRHVDFYAVTKGKKVEVQIPLEFVGESPAVKAGANVVKTMHEITLEADPMSLPQEISVDLSVLVKVGDQIHTKDLPLPSGITLVGDGLEVVALVQEVVEEAEPAPAADLSSIEVEKKGKEEKTEDGSTESTA